MSRSWAILKWLWACPLRAAILIGGATFIGLWITNQRVAAIIATTPAAMLGYFWQSALEQENERRGKK